MSIECLDLTENLSVVAAIYQNLAVGLDGLSQEGKGTFMKYLLIRCVLLLLGFNHFNL